MCQAKILHKPVLLNEVLELFSGIEEGIIVDCTLGLGGHSEAILQAKPNIRVIGIDRDEEAIRYATQRLEKFGKRFSYINGRFADKFKEILSENRVHIRGVLADIGVSSLQLDGDHRGFGFHSDVLDMRMDTKQSLDAKVIVNRYSLYELQNILRDFGEVKEYKRMATLIVQRRVEKPFESAQDLSNFLQKYFKNSRIHPATLAFQAIRIEVNDELRQLQLLLESASELKNAILGLITFHSLEDRLVKNTFRQWTKSCICDASIYKCECGNNHSKGKLITKKPIIPTFQEIASNPRSRSAKLRAFIFEKDDME
ncbi:16S rRNA (cytosine(1402)-N(4))-methyltransferase RsmH [Helicobacter sp. 13S00477-4]|uniref:16S rRNA (cytosine(1402)-N(4))-methyltransferase RsmH n=1 Tax=Helicobacter sp. 13S00477-4 TaxID=1905759 RepID=UPI000BA6689C|nr:16S rRNA (cytosine(1402)-N(4))-methyltransferase RsmH [Helicobacter sp. 13S00477-4]PAF52245.1 16S rRNA (cytosine(1402)-N(4))-methyltransferase [Helicobacter sp. 13S00477-4]